MTEDDTTNARPENHKPFSLADLDEFVSLSVGKGEERYFILPGLGTTTMTPDGALRPWVKATDEGVRKFKEWLRSHGVEIKEEGEHEGK